MRLLVTLLVLLPASVGLAAPRVSLELATDKGFPIGGAHEWHKLLSGLGVANLRIRAATGADQPAVEELGDPKNPSYRVVGILTAGNLLVVPGGKFSPRDGAAIRVWLANLADQGEAGVIERKSAFGLLGKQLVEVQEDLERPILFATKGMALADAVDKASRTLKLPTVIDASAKIAMEEVVLEDELEGISSGTALAAMLRPAGLVLAPERPKGGELQYRIAKPVEGRESWPIGWPSEKKPIDILPDLYEFVNVEISDTPVNEAVAAIAEQLKVPFLFDRNAMAWHEIDLTAVNATVPSKRSTYSLILQKVLGQAKMKPELRLDEANKPFYWVTSTKPLK